MALFAVSGPSTTDMNYDQLCLDLIGQHRFETECVEFARMRLGRVIDRRTWQPMPLCRFCSAVDPAQFAMRSDLADIGALFNGNFTRFMFDNWGGGFARCIWMESLFTGTAHENAEVWLM